MRNPPTNASKKKIKRWFQVKAHAEAYEYMYSLGMYRPRHPLPVIYSPDDIFAAYFCLALIRQMWRDL